MDDQRDYAEEQYNQWLLDHPDGDDADEDTGCPAGFSTGGFDPYGTSCELEAGHDGPHRGSDPFGGEGYVEWRGGGMCAGDPLPYRDVKFVPAP